MRQREAPLHRRRIAVIIESQFIPDEVAIYRQKFQELGATVDLVSNLWGQPSMSFYSTIEPGVVQAIQWVESTIDIRQVAPTDFAAIVAVANYPTVRLRYVEPKPSVDARQQVRSAPAAKFMADAMREKSIVKAAPCHALWLLTPYPELLAGRNVTCNPVVLADVLNAGAKYVPFYHDTPQSEQVCVDRDLVTSTSWHASERLVEIVADLISQEAGQSP